MPAGTVTRVARPAIRVRPVPPLDPPFDDELAAEVWVHAAPGQLPLFGPRAGGSAPPSAGPWPTRPVAATAVTAPAASPEARRAARRFVDVCLEVLNGYRPANQLRPLARPTEAHGLIEHLAAAAGRMPRVRRTAGRPLDLIRLRRLRVCEPIPAVVEAAAALGTGSRTWAMAFRLEQRGGAWLGTALRVLQP